MTTTTALGKSQPRLYRPLLIALFVVWAVLLFGGFALGPTDKSNSQPPKYRADRMNDATRILSPSSKDHALIVALNPRRLSFVLAFKARADATD
jgi:hypothetical protein